MRAQDVMTTSIHTLGPEDSVGKCAAAMDELNVGFFPVVDGEGRLVGVITDRDIAVRVVARGAPPNVALRDVMTSELVVCGPDDDLVEVERRMAEAHVSRIPVAAPYGRCVGVVSLSDIARCDERSRVGRLLAAISAREANPPPTLG
ncbi:MAG TPA: CBS domain-containing protein [Minicystis sp.]|nr:CBS domain-containing protein [Minicystis sp.]